MKRKKEESKKKQLSAQDKTKSSKKQKTQTENISSSAVPHAAKLNSRDFPSQVPSSEHVRSRSRSDFQKKMQEKLDSSQFRYLNEQLYTMRSNDALNLYSKQPDLFQVYHKGYTQQVAKWPINPLDVVIKLLNKPSVPDSWTVADFGCGEANLALRVKQKTVYSFDLVAGNERITVADSRNVPLPDSSVNVAVFCLSLMGTNYGDFLVEAKRVLQVGGWLIIAEVSSRFEQVGILVFKNSVGKLGFDLLMEEILNNFFVLFLFKKRKQSETQSLGKKGKKNSNTAICMPPLKACSYKKR